MDLGVRTTSTTGKVALVFPGQGSQFAGMGKDIHDASPAARAVYDEAEEALGMDIRRLCFEGPEDALNDTINAQPALLTTSIASLEALRERLAAEDIELNVRYAAGHSLGQYSALVAAGSLDLGQGVQLVRERGRLMKESGERHPGGMAAIIGLDDAALERIIAQVRSKGIVCPANYNSPGQIVISGDLVALTAAMQLAVSEGAKRVVRLAVSIGAHSPLMQIAADQFSVAIGRLRLQDARIPVVSNVTAQALTSAEEIRDDLSDHITRSVRWVQSVTAMVSGGATIFVELGPGQVLSGLVRRISREVEAVSIGDLKAIEKYLPTFAEAARRR
jgi:[acyl-carrier-protein] S-malonyltransferase